MLRPAYAKSFGGRVLFSWSAVALAKADKLSMRDCFSVPLARTLTLSLSKGESRLL